jgi:DNA-directed RNA polymerase specialized sigma subunit
MRKITYQFKTYHPWAIKALERDHYKCAECGSDNYVIVHHKDESRKKGNKNMNNSLENLITLCKSCHADAHKQTMRFKNPNIQLIIELRSQGKTFQFIADHLGISRQRVHQIYRKS